MEPGGRVAAAMVNGGFVRPPPPPPLRERRKGETVARERRRWRMRGGKEIAGVDTAWGCKRESTTISARCV